jgi:hypothetical protein
MISASGSGIGVSADKAIVRISGLPKSRQMEIITSLSDDCSVSGKISIYAVPTSRSLQLSHRAFLVVDIMAIAIFLPAS